jgi:hypothetical protein
MPVNAQAVVNVNVNTTQFNDFMAAFDKYVKLLGKTPAAWAQMSATQKGMVQSFNQGTAALMAQNEIMRKNAAHAKDVSIHSEKAHFEWKGITERGKKFGEYVLHAHEHIMKWAGILGGIMTGMGAATGWGLYGLGQWARGGSIAGSRVGMGSHELRAVKGSIGEPYGIDVEGIAKMVATAQGNPASNEYRMVKTFTGREPGNLKGTGKVTEVLLGLIERMERGDTPARIAAMSGGAFNEGDLHALWENRAGVRKAAEHAPEEAERLKIPKETEQAWNDFITHLQTGGEILKKILVVGLEPFLKTIEANSAKWLAQFEKFMNDPATKEFLELLPGRLAFAFNKIVEQLTWVGLRLGWIKRSEEDEKKYQAGLAERAKAKGVTPQVLERQETADAVAGVVGAGVGWTLKGTRENRAAFEAQVEAGAEARRAARHEVEDTLIKKFDEFFTYLRTGKQPDGSHQAGTPMVGKTGTYTLHKGEMVLPEADADLLRHSTMADWKRSISGIESGGNYGIVNPLSGATGKYQVMRANIADWTRQALGYSMSPEQFRANPAAQERVFETIFGQYVTRFGNPVDAASAWFSGMPLSGNKAGPDAMGTTVPGYIKQFLAGLGANAGRTSIDINDNTGGNVAMALSQMSSSATVSLPMHPV